LLILLGNSNHEIHKSISVGRNKFLGNCSGSDAGGLSSVSDTNLSYTIYREHV